MTMVSEDIIKEAASRGIVPGARIKCASNTGEIGVVPICDEWVTILDGAVLQFSVPHGVSPYKSIWIRDNSRWAEVLEAPKPQTLELGMSTLCGPAMRAAIMERAKELGLWNDNYDTYTGKPIIGVWCVRGNGIYEGTIHDITRLDSTNPIPTHEFLRLMENTKPPVKELTTEEKLAEAVRLLEELQLRTSPITLAGLDSMNAARAFLKSIKG